MQRTAANELASRMLMRLGIQAIWDFHAAAAMAHVIGNEAVAASLVEIAEAAEEEWLRLHGAHVRRTLDLRPDRRDG